MFRFSEGYYVEGLRDDSAQWQEAEPLQLAPEQRWYRERFYDQDHVNMVAPDSDVGPCVVSIRVLEEEDTYEAIVRYNKGVETHTVEKSRVKLPLFRRIFNLPPTMKNVVVHLCPEHFKTRFVAFTRSQSLKDRLLDLERPDVQNGKFRIGLVYAKSDQVDERDMFCNNEGSPEYEEFLEFLGDRVTLATWKGYDGGLDVANGTSGKESLYTEHDGNQIMWHVATMMPFFAADSQQLERKKFIGNDRAILLFRDAGSDPTPPNLVASKAIHVFGIISPVEKPDDPDGTYYSFSVATKLAMPATEPELPFPPVFKKGPEFKAFLLEKMMSCYAATNYAAELKQLMVCKYMHGLKTITEDFSEKEG